VGVVGPATRALLELFMNAYPDGDYPADVLKKKPAAILGASTSVPATPTAPSVPTVPVGGSAIDVISAKYDGSQAKVTIEYMDNTGNSFVVTGNTKIAIVDGVASKLGKTRADILSLIEFTGSTSSRDDDEDEDEDDEDYNIDLEIDDDEVQLSFEYDGDDYEVESDGTDEDDLLDEVADEIGEDLEDIDDDLLDAIEEALDEALEDEEDEDDEDSDEIESITARISDGEAEIEVEYGDGEEEEFTVEETLEAKIIEEVADELNIDEDEVEDMIEFKYEPVDEIEVTIKDGKALAIVTFEDGTEKRIRINSEDEDEIIEAIAEELDEDEDDVEDWVEFD
jgi:phosphotransferase system HPr-like phosphotransfer protein